jgi:hypothetical protein
MSRHGRERDDATDSGPYGASRRGDACSGDCMKGRCWPDSVVTSVRQARKRSGKSGAGDRDKWEQVGFRGRADEDPGRKLGGDRNVDRLKARRTI